MDVTSYFRMGIVGFIVGELVAGFIVGGGVVVGVGGATGLSVGEEIASLGGVTGAGVDLGKEAGVAGAGVDGGRLESDVGAIVLALPWSNTTTSYLCGKQ